MIIVTGGAGFIGSNIVKQLNKLGKNEILVVDDLTDGSKFANIADCKILDYLDKDVFLSKIIAEQPFANKISAIFHEGACSNTTEWDGNYMMRNNYEYSKTLFHYCLDEQIPFIYASSAAIYGGSKTFTEQEECEKPLNVYGYSKLLFDQYVRRYLPDPKSQVVGLRYFNVYGPREQHKGHMASVAMHLNNQIKTTGNIKLFGGYDGYGDGEQRRDFIHVDDVVAVNLWFLKNPKKSGIFNVGTGKCASFNEVAKAVLDWHRSHEKNGTLEYIPFPDKLKGHYQSFTEADISKLRTVGYPNEFKDVAQGVKEYLENIS